MPVSSMEPLSRWTVDTQLADKKKGFEEKLKEVSSFRDKSFRVRVLDPKATDLLA